jgi:putative SOS response-associated peptidase YedK
VAQPWLENADKLKCLLKLAKKGTLVHYPVGEDVGKVTNDGDYLLSLNIE